MDVNKMTAAEREQEYCAAISKGMAAALDSLNAWLQCVENPKFMDTGEQRDSALTGIRDLVQAIGTWHGVF